ncbi:MAG: tRNA lysidine(34) synthetase TilS [Burkholderiaceae bacterium]
MAPAESLIREAFDAGFQALIQACGLGSPRVLVAFSGGLDSTVLLHECVHRLGPSRVQAAHIDHRLQAGSAAWADHCRQVAQTLGVDCHTVALTPPPRFPAGLEAWARDARRAALRRLARERGADAIALAHHADDQIETVLLNLGRGAGLRGASGMNAIGRHDDVWWWRPWLDVRRAALVQVAQQRGLSWIEDPSNHDRRLRRNALRQQLLPLLEQTLPGFGENLLRHATLLGEADDLLEQLLGGASCSAPGKLDRRMLRALSSAEQGWHLRRWLAHNGLRAPSRAVLAQMRAQLVTGDSPYARIEHDGRVLRRYRDQVEVVAPDVSHTPATACTVRWQGQERLDLPGFAGVLIFAPASSGQGIARARLLGQRLTVAPLRGSARLRLNPDGPSRRLKTLCQERGVPVWERRRLPMLSDALGRPVFAAGFGADAGWLTRDPTQDLLEIRYEAL